MHLTLIINFRIPISVLQGCPNADHSLYGVPAPAPINGPPTELRYCNNNNPVIYKVLLCMPSLSKAGDYAWHLIFRDVCVIFGN